MFAVLQIDWVILDKNLLVNSSTQADSGTLLTQNCRLDEFPHNVKAAIDSLTPQGIPVHSHDMKF
jgi:biotin operon repressor